MNNVKDEVDTQIMFEKPSDSSSHDEGSSSQSSTGRRAALKKGPWTLAEDAILISYVKKHGKGNWNAVQKHSGLSRCGKSCRLRWVNHLRPELKKEPFSPAEEQAIMQLHNRIGNRWAQMAELIPGRTDNEIKNYWNTLIKRRQRAGSKPHPTVVWVQTSPENQQIENATEFNSGEKLNSTVLQGPDISKFHFDPSRANAGPLCYASSPIDLPAIGMLSPGLGSHADSVTGMLSEGVGCHTSSFLNPGVDPSRWKWESESSFRGYHSNVSAMVQKSEQLLGNDCETTYWNCRLGYPHEPDLCNKNPLSTGSIPGSHALLNGNISASSHPLGIVKVELPSLQYPGPDYSKGFTSSYAAPYEAINTYIQSPGNDQVQPGCTSPRSNGLLDALVHQSQAISCGKKQSFENIFSPPFSPSDMIESSIIEWEDISEPCSPFSQSAVSLLNQCNTPMSRDSSGLQVTRWGVEQVSTPGVQDMGDSQRPDFLRPDELLGSDFSFATFQNSVDDAIAALRAEDLLQPPSLNSYGWNSMPHVRQI